MFVDGFFVPDPPHFLHRELSSPTLNTFAVAVVTTLLTYQLTAVVYALLFIRNPHGYASVATLFSVLLARHASPLSIASHVTRWDIFTRLHYRRHLGYHVQIQRERRNVPTTVVLRLILLGAVAPLSSLVALVLAASHTREVTFREAGIGGLSLALREEDEPVEMYPMPCGQGALCVQWAVATRLPPGDTKLADVVQIQLLFVRPHWQKSAAQIAVNIHNRTFMSTFVIIDGLSLLYITAAFISLGARGLYALHVDLQDPEVYVDRGIEVAKELCGWEGEVNYPNSNFEVEEFGLEILMTKYFPCQYFTEPFDGANDTRREDLLTAMTGYVSRFGPAIVTAEGLLVKKTNLSLLQNGLDSDGMLVDGLDLVFLERRRRNCGLAVLVVLVCLLSVLRMVMRCWGRNDVGVGLERVVKHQLGLRCCEGFGEAREIVY